MSLNTPIAFCIFNRPELTRRVFEAIALAKPKKLLVIGDGARSDRPEERQLVEQTRAVVERVDWDCEVITHYSPTNLGCKQRMSSGLDWAFQISEELIVLEDDCLPDPTFFDFCQQLLERFRNDPRVMLISGNNFQPNRHSQHSYYFSHWPHIWGWASWRRAWNHFDVQISSWPEIKSDQALRSVFPGEEQYRYWAGVLDRQHAGEIDTWDFPWAYACWINSGLTILPESNLIANLGFGPDATHTTDTASRLSNLETYPIGQLNHPPRVLRNEVADQFTWDHILRPPSQPDSQGPRDRWYRRLLRSKAA